MAASFAIFNKARDIPHELADAAMKALPYEPKLPPL
jgi:hypothetical protein